MPNALYNTLLIEHLASGELEHILGEHYHGAIQAGPNAVDYPSTRESHAMRLVYDGHQIVDALPGPALTNEDLATLVARIRAELIDDAGHLVGERVLFTNVPVNGTIRYKDIFQIAPVPPGAPKANALIAEHPFSLWLRFENTPNAILRISRLQAAARQIELLLCAITTADVHGIGPSPGFYWVHVPSEPEAYGVRFCQEFYSYPGMNAVQQDFPDTFGKAVPRILDEEYGKRRGISSDREFDLPDSFEHLCDKFFALDSQGRDTFLTAAFWLRHANRVHRLSRSAYFTALISAIEAFIPPSDGGERCPTCHRPTGKGPTKSFIDFCEQFGPGDPGTKNALRKLYGIRSALSHGGKLLHSDHSIWHAGLSQARIEEWQDLEAAGVLIRAVLTGWLVSQ